MASLGERVSFIEKGERQVGTLESIQRLSNEAVILTDDGHRHLVYFAEIEQAIERLPETEYPTFGDAGVRNGHH